MFNDIPFGAAAPVVQLSTAALSSSTAAAGQLTGVGAAIVIMTNTGGTPGTYTTRTAAQMIADGALATGQSWLIILANNQGTGTLTLAGGSNVTVAGTATVAANTARLFTAIVATATTITITGLALGFTSNA